MINPVYSEIAEILKASHPDFMVSMPEAADECLTVYPPEAYHDTKGVDVFLEQNLAEFWNEDFRARRIAGPYDPQVIARAAIWELDNIQTALNEDYNS